MAEWFCSSAAVIQALHLGLPTDTRHHHRRATGVLWGLQYYSSVQMCVTSGVSLTHNTDRVHRVHTSDRAEWVHLQKVQAPPSSLSSHFIPTPPPVILRSPPTSPHTYTSACNWTGPITQNIPYSNQNTPLQWQYIPSLGQVQPSCHSSMILP